MVCFLEKNVSTHYTKTLHYVPSVLCCIRIWYHCKEPSQMITMFTFVWPHLLNLIYLCLLPHSSFRYFSKTNLCYRTAYSHGPVCEQRAGILVDISVTWSCSSTQSVKHLLQAEKDLSSALGLHQQSKCKSTRITE